MTPSIATGDDNIIVHSEWDNLNKITTSIRGSNAVNSTAGIIIQESKPNSSTDITRTLPILDQTKTCSISLLHQRICLHCMWVNLSTKHVRGLTSATGVTPVQRTPIDYYTPIDQPITEYAVVQELLERSKEATAEVGHKYTLNTFDLGVCMKALPLVWKYPERYKFHVITPGAWTLAWTGMLTAHKCRGSGYQDILLEAGLVTSGSLNSVLNGKATRLVSAPRQSLNELSGSS